MADHGSSAARLCERLEAHTPAVSMLGRDAAYRLQLDVTCKLLDVVDEVTDPVTAALITDAICERMTGDGVSGAAQRIQVRQAELERLMREPPWPVIVPGQP